MFFNPFTVNFIFPEKKGCWQLLFKNWNKMIKKDSVVPATKTRFLLSCLISLLYGTQHNFLIIKVDNVCFSQPTVRVDILSPSWNMLENTDL